ncbi:MAG: hypothetical protein KDA69_03025, partial [Planctomycetaceae bacterium]|nr:hypothetical protein [Planctomycetaceae bacterium]
ALVDADHIDYDALSIFQDNTPAANAAGTRHKLDGPYNDLVMAVHTTFLNLPFPQLILAAPGAYTAVQSHLTKTLLYGVLVDESTGVDVLGYQF